MPADGAANVRCTHCALPVPPGLVQAERAGAPAPQQFCCAGCRTAYAIIHGCGLDRYYALLRQSASDSRPAIQTSRRYAEYDDPAFHRLYVTAHAAEAPALSRIELFVDNVHCAACLWLLEKLPRVAPGVIESRVDLRRRAVTIVWDGSRIALSRVAAALDSLGYPPNPVRQGSVLAERRREDRRQLVRLGIAGACAGNVMLLAFALYAGLFDGIDPVHARIFSYLSLAFTIVSLAWPGRVFFIGAIAAIRTRTIHLDLPIALGLGAGAVWSAFITILDPLGSRVAGAGGIYYDSIAMLVFALLIGRFIQHRQQRWSADSVELLFSLGPTSARAVHGDTLCDVPVESLAPGMLVEVRAGETFPADGPVESGVSHVDQSILTGESAPVHIGPGDLVAAGATNLSSTVRLRVHSAGADTRIGRLMRLVEEASRRRAPIVQLADRIAGWFIVAMMILAAITAILWWPHGPGIAIQHAVALLIVACPCGLGLATPLAMTIALGRAARRGLLIKGADVLQTLAQPGILFIDKTGTLTDARMRLVDWHGDRALLPLLAALESQSTHPIARAIVAAAPAAAPAAPPSDPALITTALGGGIRGTVWGRAITAGTARFLTDQGIQIPPDLAARASSAAAQGLTPVLVAADGRAAALASVGDLPRPDAAPALDRIRAAGWDVRILSGDHPGAVRAVAQRLGLSPEQAIGAATPEHKLAIIEDARRHSPDRSVVMVGDGVNDAAALAAASVGIAVHGGAEASLTAADVSITRQGLAPLVELFAGAGRTMHAIRVNLVVSIAYNILAAVLCMTGIITPLLAAILMPASSLTVLGLSFRAWGRGEPTTTASSPAAAPLTDRPQAPPAGLSPTLA